MKRDDRLKIIMEILRKDGEVRFKDLAERFGLSEMTARRDLKILEAQNKIRSIVGGVSLLHPIDREENYEYKDSQRESIKKAIAKKAFDFLEPQDVILLDAGTTTFHLANILIEEGTNNLTVVTNDILIAELLVRRSSLRVIILGGAVEPSSRSTLGPSTEAQLRKIRVDKAFLGISSIDQDLHFYTPTEEKARLKNLMIKNSETTFLLCDGSKFNRKNLFLINCLDAVDFLVTDYTLTPHQRMLLENYDVELIRIKGR